MKTFLWTFALVGAQLFASAANAQAAPTDKAAARAERRVQGAEAAREFKPGEGDPKPEPMARTSKSERAAAKRAREPEAVQAARTFQPGEGDPKPAATLREPRDERRAERKANRAAVARANKAGQLPSYGDNYGGK